MDPTIDMCPACIWDPKYQCSIAWLFLYILLAMPHAAVQEVTRTCRLKYSGSEAEVVFNKWKNPEQPQTLYTTLKKTLLVNTLPSSKHTQQTTAAITEPLPQIFPAKMLVFDRHKTFLLTRVQSSLTHSTILLNIWKLGFNTTAKI